MNDKGPSETTKNRKKKQLFIKIMYIAQNGLNIFLLKSSKNYTRLQCPGTQPT